MSSFSNKNAATSKRPSSAAADRARKPPTCSASAWQRFIAKWTRRAKVNSPVAPVKSTCATRTLEAAVAPYQLSILAAFAENFHLLGGLLEFVQLLQRGSLFLQRLLVLRFHFLEQLNGGFNRRRVLHCCGSRKGRGHRRRRSRLDDDRHRRLRSRAEDRNHRDD